MAFELSKEVKEQILLQIKRDFNNLKIPNIEDNIFKKYMNCIIQSMEEAYIIELEYLEQKKKMGEI